MWTILKSCGSSEEDGMAFSWDSWDSSGFCAPHCSYVHLLNEYLLSSRYTTGTLPWLPPRPSGFKHMKMTWVFSCLLGVFQHEKEKVFFFFSSKPQLKSQCILLASTCAHSWTSPWPRQHNHLVVLCLGQIHQPGVRGKICFISLIDWGWRKVWS